VDLVQEHFELCLAAHFEARKGDWAFFFDGDYLSFGEEGSASKSILDGVGAASGDFDVDLKLALAEVGVARRIAEIPTGDHATVVEVLGGVRWNAMQFDADLEAAGTVARRDFERVYDLDFDTDWFDPLVGMRAFVPLSGKTILLLRGDIGGGVGSGSDRAWNVVTGLVFRVGETTELFAGYRWYDFERDSGDRDTNLQLEGPGIGLEMRF
jgi:opacity protein-like surface antigen